MVATRSYDVLVIGSGSGEIITDAAVAQGLRVALVDKGPLGGTCANVGCIPTKMIITAADRVLEIEEADRLYIEAKVTHIGFRDIMERMRRYRAEGRQRMRHAIEEAENLDYYNQQARFVGERTLDVNGVTIRGDMVFVVAGARPLVPPVDELDRFPYLDNESVLDLEERPDSLVVIGGGYIACELAHFFSAMGTAVTIIQRNERLVPDEEPEISERLLEVLSRRVVVHTATEAVEVRQERGDYVVITRDRDGAEGQVRGERLLVAAGRRGNADLLDVGATGVEADRRGYIRVNDYLEAGVPGIWALGDVIGKQMFKHVANREARFAWHNSQHEERVAVDYAMTPHAVFTHPQIASVGLTEAEARKDHDVLVGLAHYTDVVKGYALAAEEGLAKAVVDAESRRILGFHIIGPYAPILIQEVVDVMAVDGRASALSFGMHIHPALPEVVEKALNSLERPG